MYKAMMVRIALIFGFEKSKRKGEKQMRWKVHPEYTKYEVSDTGLVRHVKHKRILKSCPWGGYGRVSVWVNGKHKVIKIAHLVARTYLGKSNLTVNHKNGIKSDDRVENLEYLTAGENVKHAFKNGLRNDICMPIIIKGKKYYSLREGQRKTGISRHKITEYGIVCQK